MNHTQRQQLATSKSTCAKAKFHFQLSEQITLAKSLALTKRSFLRVSSKIFDALGILSAFTIVLKVAFQSICVEGRGAAESK